ncbi:DUF6624 domain-containing protein [Saccharopolyspora griseoalba]|uniref:DUF6624 domain-containing protein n=1 Tax=Saccharopolyspora griseoalba TaxID=1431848 RepID=A0ABW2LTD2_9PSEU
MTGTSDQQKLEQRIPGAALHAETGSFAEPPPGGWFGTNTSFQRRNPTAVSSPSDSGAARPADDLHAELLLRAARDQTAREKFEVNRESWASVKRLDADNTAWLAEVIAVHGWPGHALVGSDGAHAAWLLAQHATADCQCAWLELLRDAVDRDDAQASDLAYLEDRVHMHLGKPQLTGTQWFGLSRDSIRLYPLAEPDRVNALRATASLAPLAQREINDAWSLDELRGLRQASTQ